MSNERLLEGFFIVSIKRDQSIQTSKAIVTWRFDGTDDSLRNEDITQFCFPDVENVEPRNPETTPAELYTFVLNGNNGGKGKVYGYCRRVLTGGIAGRYDLPRFRPPQCLVLLSLYNFPGLYDHFLRVAHGRWLLGQAASTSTTLPSGQDAPWKDLSAMLFSLQNRIFPRPGQMITLDGICKLSPEHILTRPLDLSSSIVDVPVTPLLKKLDPRNFILLLSCLLTERRLIFIADDLCTLSTCIQAAVTLLYPFSWQNVFIPILPTALMEFTTMLDPFIIGIRSSQYAELKRQPLTEVIEVDLEKNELRGSEGMQPIPDLCQGVKERVATASNKIANFLGRREETIEMMKSSGKEGTGLSVTDALFAEVKEVHGKLRKRTGPVLFADGAVTPEDSALRLALLAFHVTVFGNHTRLLQSTGWGDLDGRPSALKYESRRFLRYRKEERGDPDHLMRFLEEFTNVRTNRMFDRYIMCLEEHQNKQQHQQQLLSPRGEVEAVPASQQEDYPVLFFRCADKLVQSGQPFFGQVVRQAVRRMMAEGELGNLQNAYEDASLHPMALDATSAKINDENVNEIFTDLCRQAYDSKTFQGILRVVWYRFADSKGKKSWLHAARSLDLLRRLLISGPESVLAESVGQIQLLERVIEATTLAAAQAEPGSAALTTDLLKLVLDIKRLDLLRKAKLDGGGSSGSPITGGGGGGGGGGGSITNNLIDDGSGPAEGGRGGGREVGAADLAAVKLERLSFQPGRPLPDFTTFHSIIEQSFGMDDAKAAALQASPSTTTMSRAHHQTGEVLLISGLNSPATPPPPSPAATSASPLLIDTSIPNRRPPPAPPQTQPSPPPPLPPPPPAIVRTSSASSSTSSSGDGEGNGIDLFAFVSDSGVVSPPAPPPPPPPAGPDGSYRPSARQYNSTPISQGCGSSPGSGSYSSSSPTPPPPPPPPTQELRERLISLSLSPPHQRQQAQEQQQQQQYQQQRWQPPPPPASQPSAATAADPFSSLSRPAAFGQAVPLQPTVTAVPHTSTFTMLKPSTSGGSLGGSTANATHSVPGWPSSGLPLMGNVASAPAAAPARPVQKQPPPPPPPPPPPRATAPSALMPPPSDTVRPSAATFGVAAMSSSGSGGIPPVAAQRNFNYQQQQQQQQPLPPVQQLQPQGSGGSTPSRSYPPPPPSPQQQQTFIQPFLPTPQAYQQQQQNQRMNYQQASSQSLSPLLPQQSLQNPYQQQQQQQQLLQTPLPSQQQQQQQQLKFRTQPSQQAPQQYFASTNGMAGLSPPQQQTTRLSQQSKAFDPFS